MASCVMRGGALAARPVALARRDRARTGRTVGIAAPEAPKGGLVALPTRPQGQSRVVLARAEGEQTASAASAQPEANGAACDVPPGMLDSQSLPENFCIIEGGDNQVRDFADMDAETLTLNIESRKNKVFIMLEEVRRLRVQMQVKSRGIDEPLKPPREYPSVVPGFPRLTEDTFQDYYIYWAASVVLFLTFGGLIAPLAEVKMGLGGTSYLDFIESVHLPRQLALVDPIVASFTGGAVGAISAFFVIEINNFKEQERKVCMYCKGTGYLACAQCSTSPKPGRLIDPVSGAKCYCSCCSGTAKVMCTSCLCTGVAMVTEHDPRIDPFGE